MKKTPSAAAVAAISFLFLFSACTNFGTKIKIEGTKGEVYYVNKATQTDALKIGNFLKQDGFFGDKKTASVQVDRKDDQYFVRFVYDKEFYAKTPWLDDFFKNYTQRMSKELFDGKKVDIALDDKYFHDFKKFPFNESATNAPAASLDEAFHKADYTHEAVGDVNYYWKGISNVESKSIVDYISSNGAFSGGTAEIYITKEGDRYVVRFPVKQEYRDDAATIAQVEKVSKEIKDNVFPNDPYSFKMTDEQLTSIRSFGY
jgi:hypothetical protein